MPVLIPSVPSLKLAPHPFLYYCYRMATLKGRPRAVILTVLACSAVLLLAGFAGFDTIVARLNWNVPELGLFASVLEIVTGKVWSDLAWPAGLLFLGAILVLAKSKAVGRAILYVGGVQFLTYLAADLTKPQFGRYRPFEAAAHGGTDRWFVGANSFPSGHVAYFAGFVLPLILLVPRAWPLLAVPVLVALQRVLSHDHYVSDVGAAFLLAGLFSWLLLGIARRTSGSDRA